MNNSYRPKRLALLALAAIAFSQITAARSAIDPAATGKALSALLTISGENIPESSSCQGNYGQQGKATVRDLLAMQLAYLYTGKNIIQGHCTTKQCTVTITHAAGEDVSSAIIKFEVAQGKASVSTLECVITP